MRDRYIRVIRELKKYGISEMQVFGQSMMPLIKSGSLLTFARKPSYAVGDIVFCNVRGRFIEAHLITKVSAEEGYLIANNKGFENGWTHTIFGKVIKSQWDGQGDYGNGYSEVKEFE